MIHIYGLHLLLLKRFELILFFAVIINSLNNSYLLQSDIIAIKNRCLKQLN